MWFSSAKVFYKQYENALKMREYKNAAFQLHQAVERFYSTVLLVFTGYKGKRHNIEKFGRQVSGYDTAFLKVFPRATKEQDEDIEIGYVFISDMSFGVGIFDPVAACVGAEEDDHV